MYIKHEGIADPDSPVGTKAMRNEATNGELVEFNLETGKARVTKEVGEALADAYDDIVVVDAEAEADDGGSD